jgi:hypothetical protein
MSRRPAETVLVYLVSDVTTALGEAFRDSPRLYRDLKISLAIMALEIRNTDILVAVCERSKLRRSFEKMAKAFEGTFRSDFVKAKYRQLKAEEETRRTLPSKWLPRLFTS